MAAAFGLYTHIQANRRRSVILIVGLSALILVVAFAANLIGEALIGRSYTLEGMLRDAAARTLTVSPLVAIGVAVWVAISWKLHQWLIDKVTDGHKLSRSDAPELYNLLENLCISRGVTMPSLRIVETDALNAFATGLTEKQYSISVTRGLVNALDRREVEAVLAHELTHIRNGDVRVMVIAAVIAGIVTFFGELVFRLIMHGSAVNIRGRGNTDEERRSGAGAAMAAIAIAMLLIAGAWFLSLALRFALSRSREFLADAGAAELTKNPDAMISALLKISGRAEIPQVPSGVMEMCIENHKAGIADLFATHPPIEQRIEALVQHAGGHMPIEAAQQLPPSFPSAPGPWGPRGA
ncbi:MAG: M48 family metallopeptidase [Beijerinckiaceae bacterium]